MTDIVNINDKRPAINTVSGPCAIAAFQAAHSFFATCQRQQQIGVLTGGTGVGKTTAAKAFAEGNHSAVYLRLTATASTQQPFLVKLCSALGCRHGVNDSKADLFDAAIDNVRERRELGRNPYRNSMSQRHRANGDAVLPHTVLIILDEFNHATAELVHTVRDLWDTERHGLVLLGTPEMTELWAPRPKNKKKNAKEFAAFKARIGQEDDLRPPTREDAALICEKMGLGGKEEQRQITELLKHWDALHKLDQLMINASAFAKDKPITVEHLRDALAVMV